MVYLYICAWAACMAGAWVHKRYSLRVGAHIHRGVYDKKALVFLELAALVLVFLLITANRTGYDIKNYVYAYEENHEAFSGREMIYAVISLAAYETGMSFYVYRALLTLFGGFLAVSFFKRIGTDMNFVLLFYLPSMLFVDSMQFRNAAAYMILLWSFRYLVWQGKYAWIKFAACILLIAQIHTVYYFAFILMACFLKNERKQIAAFLFLFSICFIVLTALNGNQVPLFQVLADLFLSSSDGRGKAYYTAGRLGWIIPAAIHAATTLLGLAADRQAHLRKSELTACQLEYLDIAVIYNLLLFITIPAVMMNMHYYRIIRGAFMINVVGVSFLFKKKGRFHKFQLFSFLTLAVLALMWCVLDLVIIEDSAEMAAPVLNGKLFFLP